MNLVDFGTEIQISGRPIPNTGRICTNEAHDAKFGHKSDPTGTRKIRAAYDAALNARLRRVKAYINKTLIKDGLMNRPEFRDATPFQRQQMLSSFIGRQINRSFKGFDPNPFVSKTYKKAVRDLAKENGIKAPATLLKNESQLSKYSLGRRNQFNRELIAKLTRDLQNDIDEHLAKTVTEQNLRGRAVANVLTGRIDTLGRNRAKVIANTEVIATYADASLDFAENEGIENVEAEVEEKMEFTTAGDGKVCPLCVPLEGQIYTIEEARGVIPVHPNCRCRWKPVKE